MSTRPSSFLLFSFLNQIAGGAVGFDAHQNANFLHFL